MCPSIFKKKVCMFSILKKKKSCVNLFFLKKFTYFSNKPIKNFFFIVFLPPPQTKNKISKQSLKNLFHSPNHGL